MVSARKIHCANLTDTHFVGKENVAIIRKSKEKKKKNFFMPACRCQVPLAKIKRSELFSFRASIRNMYSEELELNEFSLNGKMRKLSALAAQVLESHFRWLNI